MTTESLLLRTLPLLLVPAVLGGILPQTCPGETLFGTGFPREERKSPKVVKITRTYEVRWVLVTVPLFAGLFFIPRRETMVRGYLMTGIPFLLGVYTWALVEANEALKRYKEIRGILGFELSLPFFEGEREIDFSRKLFLLPFFILSLGILGTFFLRDSLPGTIPTHFGISGPDVWREKTPWNLWKPMVYGTGGTLVFYVLTGGILRGREGPTYGNSGENLWSWYFWLVSIGESVLFTWSQFMTLYPRPLGNPKGSKAFLSYSLILTILVILGALFLMIRGGREPSLSRKSLWEEPYWRLGGILYDNPYSPGIAAPRRVSLGLGVNLATFPGKALALSLGLILMGSFVGGLVMMAVG